MEPSVIMLLSLMIGWLLDHFWGDPEALPHPVVYMGRWISFWEHRLNKGSHRKAKGAVLAVLSVVGTFALLEAVIVMLRHFSLAYSPLWSYVVLIFQSVVLFFCLAGKTLRHEVEMVFQALDRSLEAGRKQVARIVGRDTQELSAQEVRTAALETLAENLSDGFVAPLFWFLLLGVPGMMMYKMINTLDSMIGYHSPRYIDFGCWAARIDDVANFIPARITALFIALIGTFYAHNGLFRRLAFVWKYGPQHASPNSGWPEAALASVLDCQFGGAHKYFGELFYKPSIGDNPRLLNNKDLRISLKISLWSEFLSVVAVAVCIL